MLKGIASWISPDLLRALAEMGHGDEITLADAHFPGPSMHPRCLRADGLSIALLLQGILPLLELDAYESPLIMMAAVEGDQLDPDVEHRYMEVVHRYAPGMAVPLRMERFAFYERARRGFAIVMTGETAKYGNIILKKGVTPIE